MSLLGRFFGVVRDDPDSRDHRFINTHPDAEEIALADEVDLHKRLPPAWHQQHIGSCVGQGTGGLMKYLFPDFSPSTLAIYYETRAREGNADRDGGCQIRNALKVLQKTGAMSEDEWPYDVERWADQPPETAERRTIAAYSRIVSEVEALSCLALKQPFLLAMMLPADFDSEVGRHGVMTLPAGKVEYLGNHCMLAVGYHLDFRKSPDVAAAGVDPSRVESTALLVRNSFGPWWGLKSRPGHCWVPLSWVLNPSTGGDCWTGHKLFTTASEPQGPTVAGVPVQGSFQN